MKIVNAFPPNYAEIAKAFQFDPERVVFVYGDTLYRPGKDTLKIPYDLRVHEETHMKQQAIQTPQLWWKQYIDSPGFRLYQEVEAYSAQYLVLSKPDREKHIRRLTGDLSGPMYGNLVSFDEAKKLIRGGAPVLDSGAIKPRGWEWEVVGGFA